MTDRERLIDLIKKAEKQELLDFFTADLDEAIDMSGGTQFNGTVEHLANYLISNDVVVLPCKAGTIVWILRKDRVPDDDYRMNFHDEWVICEVSFQLSMINQIGKTVFLTREEAEEKLKERKRNV